MRSAVRQTRYLRLSAGYGCARLRQCTGQLARVLTGRARTRTTEGASRPVAAGGTSGLQDPPFDHGGRGLFPESHQIHRQLRSRRRYLFLVGRRNR
jgi:hypothetical protein